MRFNVHYLRISATWEVPLVAKTSIIFQGFVEIYKCEIPDPNSVFRCFDIPLPMIQKLSKITITLERRTIGGNLPEVFTPRMPSAERGGNEQTWSVVLRMIYSLAARFSKGVELSGYAK